MTRTAAKSGGRERSECLPDSSNTLLFEVSRIPMVGKAVKDFV
jgi:hypothetical protein